MIKELRVAEEMQLFIYSKRKTKIGTSSNYYQTVSVLASVFYELVAEGSFSLKSDGNIKCSSTIIPQTYYGKIVYDEVALSDKKRQVKSWIAYFVNRPKLFRLILNDITMSLEKKRVVRRFENKKLFIKYDKISINIESLEHSIQKIRAEFLENAPVTDDTAFLAIMLHYNGLLKKYFSKYENEQLKNRIQEIKDEPISKAAKYVIDSMQTAKRVAFSG